MEITTEDTNKVTEQFIAARDYVIENEAYLRGKYQGRCMAILDGVVIDTDKNPVDLWNRTSKKPFEEGNFDKYPVTGSVDSFLADNGVLEEILFGENGRMFEGIGGI